MKRRELWMVIVASAISSLVTMGGLMAVWSGQEVLAKDNSTPQKEVRAQQFVLVDYDGKTRAGLFLMANGEPRLSLYDRDYKIRASLVAMDDGAGLILSDKHGMDRVIMRVSTNGEASLTLSDENRPRAVLGQTDLESKQTGTVEKRPASSLVLFDKEGKAIWKAP